MAIAVTRCNKCGKEEKKYPQKFFYKARNQVWEANGHYLPICKQCIKEMLDEFTELYDGDDQMVVRRMCAFLDIYYCDAMFYSALKTKPSYGSCFPTYMQRINIKQYKNKTYFDTYLDELKENQIKMEEIIVKQEQNPIPEEVIKRFGKGYTYEDYDFLQTEYNDWTTRHECKTKSQEEIFMRLACTKLAIMKKQIDNESTKELDKLYQDLLASANLQPRQMKDGSGTEGKTLSLLIKEWEDTKPIIMRDKEFEDVDHIQTYIDVFYKGGLASGMGLKGNYFSKTYNKIMDKLTAKKRETEVEHDVSNDKLFDEIFGDDNEE